MRETQLSVVIESDTLFQAEARFDTVLSDDVLSVDVGGQSVTLSQALFSTLYDVSVDSNENASTAGSRIISELDNILQQRGNLASVVNDVNLSADRLSSYVIAEQTSLAKKERDFADSAISLAKNNLRSQANNSLMVQARGINRNLTEILLH